jgi:hypothetical protein
VTPAIRLRLYSVRERPSGLSSSTVYMDVITWQTRPFERRKKARHNANHASMRAIFMLLFTPVNISFRKG